MCMFYSKMAPCTHPGMKRLICLTAKNGLGRFALSALPHYNNTTTARRPATCRPQLRSVGHCSSSRWVKGTMSSPVGGRLPSLDESKSSFFLPSSTDTQIDTGCLPHPSIPLQETHFCRRPVPFTPHLLPVSGHVPYDTTTVEEIANITRH